MKYKIIYLTLIMLLSNCLFLFAQEFSFTMEITEYKKGKTEVKETNTIYYGMKGDMVIMQPNDKEGRDMRMLFNKTENTMTMLTNDNGEKSGMKLPMRNNTVQEYDFENYEENVKEAPNFRKTGKTEKIEDHICYQFIATEDGETIELWMTTDLGIAYYQLFDFYGMNQGPMSPQEKQNSSGILPMEFRKYGFPLKVISTDKEGEKTKLVFKNISKSVDASKLSTEGYELRDMSKMHMMKQLHD